MQVDISKSITFEVTQGFTWLFGQKQQKTEMQRINKSEV